MLITHLIFKIKGCFFLPISLLSHYIFYFPVTMRTVRLYSLIYFFLPCIQFSDIHPVSIFLKIWYLSFNVKILVCLGELGLPLLYYPMLCDCGDAVRCMASPEYMENLLSLHMFLYHLGGSSNFLGVLSNPRVHSEYPQCEVSFQFQ